MDKMNSVGKLDKMDGQNKSLNIRNILYLLSLCIFIVPVFYIAFKAFNLEEANVLSTIIVGKKVYIYMILGIVAIVGFLYNVYTLVLGNKKELTENVGGIGKKENNIIRFLPYIILIIICGLQIAFVICQKAHLRYDTLKIFDQAVWIAEGNELSPEYSNGYFAIYPNNIPLCIITAWLLKIPMFIGMDKSLLMLYVQIINCIMISLAYFFTYKTLEYIRKTSGILFLLICLFNPMTYVLAPFYYTHTFSMFFSCGAIYLFALIFDKYKEGRAFELNKKKDVKVLIYAVLMGILLVLGVKVRATVGIVGIALFIYLILQIKCIINNSVKLKNFFKILCGFLAGCIASFAIFTAIQSIYVKYDYKETGYPSTNWIMLGLSSTAGYNAADDEAIKNLSTKEERNAYAVSQIKSRINTIGVSGLLTHGKYKLRLTWSDGVDDFIDNISATSIGSTKDDLISGQKNDMLVAYSHIYCATLFLSIFVAVMGSIISTFMFFIKKRKSENIFCISSDGKIGLEYIFILNLLGGIMFHLVWEAGQVYSISFMCSTMALATLGIMEIANCLNKLTNSNTVFSNAKKNGKIVNAIAMAVCILLGCGLMLFTHNRLGKTVSMHYSLAVKQDLSELSELDTPLLTDTYTQTFTVQKPFNTFGVKVFNALGADNCSLYKISIKNADGTVITTQDILGANAFNNDFYTIEFPTIIPNGKTEYMVTITPEIVSDVHSLIFGAYNTNNYDIYENGCLYVNDSATLSDLAFKVMYKYEGAYWQ